MNCFPFPQIATGAADVGLRMSRCVAELVQSPSIPFYQTKYSLPSNRYTFASYVPRDGMGKHLSNWDEDLVVETSRRQETLTIVNFCT